MVRNVLADEYLLSYLTGLKQNTYSLGLILGQTVQGKDYVIHFAKTPPYQSEEAKKEGAPAKPLKTINDVNENWVADHARHATRMLPGGMHVLGVFVVSQEELLNPFAAKLKIILNQIHKQLSSNKYMYGNADSEKIVLNYCTKTQKHYCKSYDVNTSNVMPADFKFVPKAAKWNNLECKYEVDQLYHIKENETDWPLKKHMSVILDQINESLQRAVFMYDGEAKDFDESLENIGKKRKMPRSSKSGYQELHDNIKAIQVSIFQSCDFDDSTEQGIAFEIRDIGGQIRIIGQVACKLWLHPKVSIGAASLAVVQDIMRSLATRLEMHWDSLTEEECSEDINSIHEPPRRVLVTLPNSKITLSDYLFPGEGPQDAQISLEEMLDIKIKDKNDIQEVEAQADISDYYSQATESESDMALPKLATDTNKFMYIVGLVVALIVLVVSLIIHFLLQ